MAQNKLKPKNRTFHSRTVRGNGRKVRKGKIVRRRKGTNRHPI